MTNREQIKQAVELKGIYSLGNYDTKLDKLTAKDIQEVCSTLKHYPTAIIKVSKGWIEAEEGADEVDVRFLTNGQKVQIYGEEE